MFFELECYLQNDKGGLKVMCQAAFKVNNDLLLNRSIHSSISLCLSGIGAQGQQSKQESPDFPFLSYFPQLLPGGSQGFARPVEKHITHLSSVFWAFPDSFYWRDMPWTSHQGGGREAPWLDARATSSCSSQYARRAEVLLRSPLRWHSFSPCHYGRAQSQYGGSSFCLVISTSAGGHGLLKPIWPHNL